MHGTETTGSERGSSLTVAERKGVSEVAEDTGALGLFLRSVNAGYTRSTCEGPWRFHYDSHPCPCLSRPAGGPLGSYGRRSSWAVRLGLRPQDPGEPWRDGGGGLREEWPLCRQHGGGGNLKRSGSSNL